MKKQNDRITGFAMALFVLILFCILCLVVLGSRLYKNLVEAEAAENARRASLTYVVQQLCAADEAAAVTIAAGPQGDMLVLREPREDTGYETRIYLYNGSLMEEYLPTEADCNPEGAQVIATTATFAAEQPAAGLVRITTGEGTAAVYLHSMGGAA